MSIFAKFKWEFCSSVDACILIFEFKKDEKTWPFMRLIQTVEDGKALSKIITVATD